MLGIGKKGESGESRNTKEAKAAKQGMTILKLNLPPIAMVVVLILVCGYVSYLQYAALMQQARQVQHVADAERMAALVGGQLVSLGDQVARQAKSDSALSMAIASEDREALRRYESGLRSYFPEAERIRVILPSETNPDDSVTPPIGYACLDLARQSEGGSDRPPLEMHLHGTEHAHLDLVRPIREGGKVIASLMVSFPPAMIESWLKQLQLDAGYLELQQGWDGPVLGSLGDSGVKRPDPSHRATVSGSDWQLSYWATDTVGMAQAKMVGYLATFAITALIAAVLIFFYAGFVSARIKRDLRGMAQFMLESSQGKRFHSYPVSLAEMEATLHAMEPVLGMKKSNDDVKKKAEDGDAGAADLMFMDFGEISVEEESGDEPPEQQK